MNIMRAVLLIMVATNVGPVVGKEAWPGDEIDTSIPTIHVTPPSTVLDLLDVGACQTFEDCPLAVEGSCKSLLRKVVPTKGNYMPDFPGTCRFIEPGTVHELPGPQIVRLIFSIRYREPQPRFIVAICHCPEHRNGRRRAIFIDGTIQRFKSDELLMEMMEKSWQELAKFDEANSRPQGAEILEIQKNITLLTSDDYSVREKATKALIDAGFKALQFVRNALLEADPELRVRCEKILGESKAWDEQRSQREILMKHLIIQKNEPNQ